MKTKPTKQAKKTNRRSNKAEGESLFSVECRVRGGLLEEIARRTDFDPDGALALAQAYRMLAPVE